MLYVTLQIPSKANALSVDGCSKTGVLFGDLIAAVEAVNCRWVRGWVEARTGPESL